MDTRAAPETVGPRATPIGQGETYSISVIGVVGNCTIPAEAIGLGMNVTAIAPTAGSFLTVFPSLAIRPTASSLNWVAGQAPVPNAVTTNIGTDGKVSFFNNGGTVNLAADIVGYYVSHEHSVPIVGADILNGTITSEDVLDFSLSNQDVGVLFAQVNADGTIANSSGGTIDPPLPAPTGIHLSAGRYEVDFGRDITNCAFVISQGEAGVGSALGAITGATDRAGNANGVFATTRDAAGVLADNAFQLVVVC